MALAAAACVPGRVRAQTRTDAPIDRAENPAGASAEAGQFLPLTISARTDSQRAFVLAFGGYDSAKDSAQSEAVVDVTTVDWLALRAGVLYLQSPSRVRPMFGVRAQALKQENAGIDLGFGVYYKPEGFTEAEGEIEVVAAFGRRFGKLSTFANLVYGQEPEAEERDGEVRLAALYSLSSSVQAGLDARMRFDLGEEEGEEGEAREEGHGEYDLIVGPTASLAMGPMAAILQLGLSVQGTEPAQTGAVALIGVAGAL